MAVNKVVRGDGTSLIDLTGDTVTSAEHIMAGYVGHLADGSQVTGTGSGGPSATAHSIYMEFADGTDLTIPVYYDNALVETMITAYIPTTVDGKTVTLAQLDGVTWYEPADIPLNTQLIDFNAVLRGYGIDADGSITPSDTYNCVTDYTPIDSTMTFSFTCRQYAYIGFYDNNKTAIGVVVADDIKESAVDYTAFGFLTPAIIPSNAVYVALLGNSYNVTGSLSLIRTA